MKYIKLLITAVILLAINTNSYAAIVIQPVSWSNGDSVTAAKLNQNWTALGAAINGGLDNTNANTVGGYRFYETLASLPSAGNQGRVVFNTADNTFNTDNGSSWQTTVTPTGSPATGYIPYYNSGWKLLAPGAQYLPLVSNGTSSLPTYQKVDLVNGSNWASQAQGDIVYASSGTQVARLAPGTSGQFLQTQGAAANPQYAFVPWVPTNMQVFTSSGTWTKPIGYTRAYVKVWGPGGGGGCGNSNNGAGGGGGGYSEGYVNVSTNVTVTVGTGGAGCSSGGTGANGSGSSSFAGDTTISAGSGQGNSVAIGGAGGTATTGILNIPGQAGQSANTLGYGGGSWESGIQPVTSTAGVNGFFPGQGGSGGNPSGNAGGTGSNGMVIVYY